MEKAVVTSLNSRKNTEVDSMTLSEWVHEHHSEDEMRSIFLNMDRALKYIHEHGYCIEEFHPTKINVLNNNDAYVQFKKLMELSKDPISSREMIKENIFRSSIMQIALYLQMPPEHLNIEFLKENFDSFAQFVPQDDVPYYRGVIQRDASVYYCEYVSEKKKRELEELEKQYGDEKDKTLIKNYQEKDITNKRVNDLIYRQISGIQDAAFINLMVIPLVMFSILVIYLVTVIIMNAL